MSQSDWGSIAKPWPNIGTGQGMTRTSHATDGGSVRSIRTWIISCIGLKSGLNFRRNGYIRRLFVRATKALGEAYGVPSVRSVSRPERNGLSRNLGAVLKREGRFEMSRPERNAPRPSEQSSPKTPV